jgi:hypothetical protein
MDPSSHPQHDHIRDSRIRARALLETADDRLRQAAELLGWPEQFAEPRAHERLGLVTGMSVVDVNGEDLGRVVALRARYYVAKKGVLFMTTYYLRYSDIASVVGVGDVIRLRVAKAATLRMNWNQELIDSRVRT